MHCVCIQGEIQAKLINSNVHDPKTGMCHHEMSCLMMMMMIFHGEKPFIVAS